jgi:hypothetical protein
MTENFEDPLESLNKQFQGKVELINDRLLALNTVSKMFFDTENFAKCAAWGKLVKWLLEKYPQIQLEKARQTR